MNLIENVELDNIVSAKSQIQILSQIKSTTELKNRISTTKIYSMSGEFLRYTVYKYGKTFTEGVVEEYAPNDHRHPCRPRGRHPIRSEPLQRRAIGTT